MSRRWRSSRNTTIPRPEGCGRRAPLPASRRPRPRSEAAPRRSAHTPTRCLARSAIRPSRLPGCARKAQRAEPVRRSQSQVMAQSHTVFSGSIPPLYDRYLGPLIFAPYASDLAARIVRGSAERVLETAAGTGVLTRALAASLPGAAKIIATDLNQPMLDFAAAQPGGESVQWQQADALALP